MLASFFCSSHKNSDSKKMLLVLRLLIERWCRKPPRNVHMHTTRRYLSGLGSLMLYMQMACVVSAYDVFWFALPHIPASSVLANWSSVQNRCTHILLVLRCSIPATEESHHFRRFQTISGGFSLPVHWHGPAVADWPCKEDQHADICISLCPLWSYPHVGSMLPTSILIWQETWAQKIPQST